MEKEEEKTEKIMELMTTYEWMPASIARYVVENGIDLGKIPEAGNASMGA